VPHARPRIARGRAVMARGTFRPYLCQGKSTASGRADGGGEVSTARFPEAAIAMGPICSGGWQIVCYLGLANSRSSPKPFATHSAARIRAKSAAPGSSLATAVSIMTRISPTHLKGLQGSGLSWSIRRIA